jgi:hypothetical protein
MSSLSAPGPANNRMCNRIQRTGTSVSRPRFSHLFRPFSLAAWSSANLPHRGGAFQAV